MSKAYITLEASPEKLRHINTVIFIIYSICLAELWIIACIAFQLNLFFYLAVIFSIPFILLVLKMKKYARITNKSFSKYLNESLNPSSCILEEEAKLP